ncbi:hypothetical protein RB195_014735 [Necator americanus]|uniref:Uncharacterized protein n=1 Tax=Necator americanus TaxID=51031 RepID=A0ABR1E1G8_NECAM
MGLQLNLQKTMFMRNGWVSDAPFTLNRTTISERTSYVYPGRKKNIKNDLTPELGRRRRAAWGAYKSIEDVVEKTKNTRLRAHLFNPTVLPALTYPSETSAFHKQEGNAISITEREIERVMLGATRFMQVKKGIRSSLLRHRENIRDAAAYAKESKIRWAGHRSRRQPYAAPHQRPHTPQKDRRPDGQTFLRSISKKSTTLFESLARRDARGQH